MFSNKTGDAETILLRYIAGAEEKATNFYAARQQDASPHNFLAVPLYIVLICRRCLNESPQCKSLQM
jgi:hypothetical protein